MWLKYLRSFAPISLSDMAMALGDPLIALTLASLPEGTNYLAAFGVGKAIAVFFESPIISILQASNVMTRSPEASRSLFHFVLLFGTLLSLGLAFIGSQIQYIGMFSSQFQPNTVEKVYQFTLILAIWPLLIAIRRFWQGRLIHTGHSQVVASGAILRLILMGAMLLILPSGIGEGHIIAALAMMVGLFGETGIVTWKGSRLVPIALLTQDALKPMEEKTRNYLPTDITGVCNFYRPLAISMTCLWGSRLGVTLMISVTGQLAVASWAAGWALVLSISNGVRMLQQVTIRFYSRRESSQLFTFSVSIGLFFSFVLFFISTSNEGKKLLLQYCGSKETLMEQVLNIVWWSVPLPILMAMQNYFQGLLMVKQKTRQISNLSVAFNGVLLVLVCALTSVGLLTVVSLCQVMVLVTLLEVSLLARIMSNKNSLRRALIYKKTAKELL